MNPENEPPREHPPIESPSSAGSGEKLEPAAAQFSEKKLAWWRAKLAAERNEDAYSRAYADEQAAMEAGIEDLAVSRKIVTDERRALMDASREHLNAAASEMRAAAGELETSASGAGKDSASAVERVSSAVDARFAAEIAGDPRASRMMNISPRD